MGLYNDIKGNVRGANMSANSAMEMVIYETLNKLFYATPDLSNEVKFLQMKRGTEEQGRTGLHASAMIVSDKEFCYREQVLSLYYKQLQGENVPVDLKRIFSEGDAIHEKWQRMFIRGKLGIAEDMDHTNFNKKYKVGFSPDAKIHICKSDMLVEIKSVNTFQFQHMKSHPSGRKQLQLYMYLTGIHKGFVLAEDKNTQQFKIFYEEYDFDTVQPFIERLEAVKAYAIRLKQEHKMVGRMEGCSSAYCKRATKCNMRDACFNIGMGRIKL